MLAQDEVFHFSDEIGPEKLLYVNDLKTKMRGILVLPDFMANAGGLTTGAL